MNKPILLRMLRALLLGLVGALAGMLGLLVLLDGAVAGGGISWGSWVEGAFGALPLVALLAGTVGVVVAERLLREARAPVIAMGLVIVGGIMVGTTLDDPEFARPLTFAEFSPDVPRGDESWELSVRDWPQAALNAMSAGSSDVSLRASFATDPDKFITELAGKRDKIEQAWANLADAREWFARLNSFPEIGDATPARVEAPTLKFQVVRAVTQVAAARAALFALDGRGDEAVELLLPVIEVSRKLEPGSRTMLRTAIARIMLSSSMESLRFVLARAEVSPERRAALATVLEQGMGGPEGARRMILCEYVMRYDGYLRHGVPGGVSVGAGGGRGLLWLQRPFFLPRATANLHAAHAEELARLAEKRDYAKMKTCEQTYSESLGGFQLKNPIGRAVAQMSSFAYQKVIESYWAREDARLALIAELRKPK